MYLGVGQDNGYMYMYMYFSGFIKPSHVFVEGQVMLHCI